MKLLNPPSYSEEEWALYNPAYMAFLTYSFIRSYTEFERDSISSNLLFLAIPFAASSAISKQLPRSTSTPIIKWINENQHILVAIPSILESFSPLVISAVEFLIDNEFLSIDESGYVFLSNKSLPKGPTLFNQSPSMKEALRASQFAGKWFSKSNSELTIFINFGVKP
ncbi:hypothetical protein EDB59_1093 [Vibrio crassostreae]|uniref:three component ABC system middle component n=1 Tax=Vibrio crassostreae TaxID=246167 RepID=UPI000F472340|nr:three component ABC system middle component [Vibrio crassostreae]ROR70439.1 hypothetical protein EDB59_1093 [Vibrio crassostreae]